MKIARFSLLLMTFLLVFNFGVSAAGIWIPDPGEVGDVQTDKPFKPETDESGQVHPDDIPHEVNTQTDILKPTAICITIAVIAYLLLRIIRFLLERHQAKQNT